MITLKDIIKDNNFLIHKKSSNINIPLNKRNLLAIKKMEEYILNSNNKELIKKYNYKQAVGIAAIQVGYLINAFIVYYLPKKINLLIINPQIIKYSKKMCYLDCGEGCLSVDKWQKSIVLRHYEITIKGFDYYNKEEIIKTFKGFLAIICQHEYDHLNGVLYTDRINNAPKNEIVKAIKISKTNYRHEN